MLSKVLITLVLHICLPIAIKGSPEDIDTIVNIAANRPGPHLIVSDFNQVMVEKVKGTKLTRDDLQDLRSNVIQPLINTKKVTFYVASSKPASELTNLLGGVEDLGISAEHNMQVQHSGQSGFVLGTDVELEDFKNALKVFERHKPRGVNIKDTEHAFTRHFRIEGANDEQVEQWLEKAPDGFDAVRTGNEVMFASKERGKGNLVKALLENDFFKFGISLGDKQADMGMHDAMREKGFVGIIVGEAMKGHKEEGIYHLTGPDEVRELFRRLTAIY